MLSDILSDMLRDMLSEMLSDMCNNMRNDMLSATLTTLGKSNTAICMREEACSRLPPPWEVLVSSPFCHPDNTLGTGLATADVVPLVQQHVLDAGAQACGAVPLCCKGPAVLRTKGAKDCHDDKGSQGGLDQI